MKLKLDESVFTAAFVLTGLFSVSGPALLLAFLGDDKSLAMLLLVVAGVLGWGLAKLLLMLINRAAMDSQGRLVDRRGRPICEQGRHPLAFSLRTLFLVMTGCAVAATPAQMLLKSGDLETVMYLMTPAIPLAGGFFHLYAKRRGVRCGRLVVFYTLCAVLVWLLIATYLPRRRAPPFMWGSTISYPISRAPRGISDRGASRSQKGFH